MTNADFKSRIVTKISTCGGKTQKRVPSEGWHSFIALGSPYFAALAALIASISMGVTLNRSPQMP